MAAAFITYYSINSLFAAHLQTDLHLSTAMIATPTCWRFCRAPRAAGFRIASAGAGR
jgi:hypothetical protein